MEADHKSNDPEYAKMREDAEQERKFLLAEGILRETHPEVINEPLSAFCDAQVYAQMQLANRTIDRQNTASLVRVAAGSVSLEAELREWMRTNPALVAEIMQGVTN